MPRVTIGVPVYNSENLLEQCLENLAAQTFTDFKVIVLDNASTDRTGAIASKFAARDTRFTYIRQPHNKGARQNFSDVLKMAETPYFMWRSDDDLSDVNFIEVTLRLLDDTPDAGLAVGRSVLDKGGRRRRKTFPHRWPLEPQAAYRARLLLKSRATWLFGLFRTEELRKSLERVDAEYRHVTAFDHLTLFPFLINLRTVGSDRTTFVTGYVQRETNARKGSLMDPKKMKALRRDFLGFCFKYTPLLTGSRAMSLLMTPVMWLYAERTYRTSKILTARLRMFMGEKPFGTTTKYD